MSRRPSAVIFDLGKVLVDFDYGLVVGRLASRSEATREELGHLILESPILPAYERGELTSRQFFSAVRERARFAGEYEEFAEFFADIFTEIPPMIRLQSELRSRQVPTFIFSNTNDLAVQHIRRRFPFFANFDGYVLSYEHGVMKPDKPVYEVVEKLTAREGPDLLYLDDRPENVATASGRGWRTILHHDPAESRAQIMGWGLL